MPKALARILHQQRPLRPRRLAPAVLLVVLLLEPACGDVAILRPPEREGDEVGECADGADNDGNSLYDCDDPACSGAPECQDNLPPAGHVVRIDPAAPTTTEDLLCVVETAALDPEGDPVEYSYSWLLDGEAIEIDGATVSSTETERSQVWSCGVTPSDEWASGPSATGLTTIENSPPTAPGVSISPGAPKVWDDIICDVDVPSFDADGDDVTYSFEWIVDGSPAGISGSIVGWTQIQSGQTWGCIATPFDGIDEGPTGEDNAMVGVELTPHVSTGRYHSCGVPPNGAYDCWGIDDDSGDDYGQVTGAKPAIYVELTTGADHTCGMDFNSGEVDCWGDDSLGQTLGPSDSFMHIEAGWSHTCGVRYDGGILCWGSSTWWTSQAPSQPALAITSGNEFSCARLDDDSIECWGVDAGSPSFSDPSGEWLQIDAGEGHLCAVSESGVGSCWGEDNYGQVSDIPTVAFAQISAGRRHSCGVDRDSGVVHCWGDNSAGQTSGTPAGSFIWVSAGWYQSCGARDNGTFECWGCAGSDKGQCDP